jgi:N-acetylglucosaminyldiphosphoundecaprenol N-acetyl-beta-D-mannosaminyltransferase
MRAESNPRIRFSLLGVNITCHDALSLHANIRDLVQREERGLILNVNVNCLNLAYENPWLLRFLNEAHLVYSDGAGVQLAARLLGHAVPPRVTFADWIWDLAEFCQSQAYSLYFLGARPDIASRAADVLQRRLPRLQVVGTHHGYFNKLKGGPENERVVAKINACRPDMLIVGFGMPAQEAWLKDNWPDLDVHVGLTGGAVFDYVSGALRRPPQWMTNNGLEWFGRLLIEPRRLWRRYLIGNPLFLWRILQQRLWPVGG